MRPVSRSFAQCRREAPGELQPEHCWRLLAEQVQFARPSFNTFREHRLQRVTVSALSFNRTMKLR
jgi:hypothetical protein